MNCKIKSMLKKNVSHHPKQEENEGITSLTMEGITKRFPGLLALNNVNIEIGKGEILALVGENGAGKTTLMNVLMGLYQADEGRITVNGKEIKFKGPEDAFKIGIGMVHQQYMLVPNLTVAENIALGMKNAHKLYKVDMQAVRKKIDEVSEKYGLVVNPDAYIYQISVGEQQRVELVKTLCLGAKFLILDEPTSALTPQETDELIKLLLTMKDKLSIIFISHKLAEVKALSNKVVILRHGEVVFKGNTADYSASEIASKMTGHEVVLPQNTEEDMHGEVALDVKNISVLSDRGAMALNGLNLCIHSGEIVGRAGVSGNGQRELAEAINGLRRVESGTIELFGQEIQNTSVHSVIERGMGYIPEERNIEGIVPPFSIKENYILKDSDNEVYSKKGLFINAKQVQKNAEKLVKEFDVRTSSIELSAGSLSGGNIQKVILAREMTRNPKFLISVYPTRGLDLGAIEFIHKKLLDKRRNGVGILLISEELDEIMSLSDKIAVIYKGRIQKILRREEATRAKLGMLMAGVNDEQ